MTDPERAALERKISELFERWWSQDGRYIDTDTNDVDWYDKRQELAGVAFTAGYNTLQQRIAELERENERLDKTNKAGAEWAFLQMSKLRAEIATLTAALKTAREALKQFMSSTGKGGNGGEHAQNCFMRFSCYPPNDCTCGVSLAKTALQAIDKAGE